MTPHFERVAIAGVGLLGASLGLALKARGMAGRIVGVGRRQSTLDKALAAGAVDSVSLDISAASDADLILLAPPAGLVIPMLDELRGLCKPSAIVTDVASTKAAICAHADATWAAPRRFVGSHPMAGSEKYGPEHGRADFYEGSVCLLETGEHLEPQARATVAALWQAVGARVVDVQPASHDLFLAYTSHIPHVVSAAMASLALEQGDVRPMIGNAFRDMTRIAASRPEVWRDICLTNKAAVLEGLQAYLRELGRFSELLASGNTDGLEAFFRAGNEARNRAVEP